ncbi:hypothetical protein [Thermostaphylospora chromogena]|nr:hypothetical protein [Thermostaphylospora chromogena]
MDLTAGPGAATELRRGAEALLAHLAAGGTTPFTMPKLPDIDGYWLPPAIEALVAIMSGDDPVEPLSRAAQRDEQHTALFLCLALAVAGQGDRIHASWLGIAFGELSVDRPVTHGQRALWIAAARGAYGPAGKIFVLRKLDSVTLPADENPGRWLSALVPAEPAVVVPPSLADFPELAEIPEIAEPTQAASRLARLRGRCVEITSSRRPEGSPSPPLGNQEQRPATAWQHDEPLAVLRTLVGASGPEGPMGSLVGYLLEDLSPGADPDLAAAALHVVSPIIRSAAENLAAATKTAPPTSITAPLLGHSIVLRPAGPDASSLAAAEREIVHSMPPRPGPARPYGAITLGVVLVIAAVVVCLWGAAGWALVAAAVLALAGIGLGGFGAWLRHTATLQAQADAQAVAGQVAELRELAERAVAALHEYAREAEARAKAADDDLAELTRLIRRGPRAI